MRSHSYPKSFVFIIASRKHETGPRYSKVAPSCWWQGKFQPTGDRASSAASRCYQRWASTNSEWGSLYPVSQAAHFINLGHMLKCTKLWGWGGLFTHVFSPWFHTYLLNITNVPGTLLGTEVLKLSKVGGPCPPGVQKLIYKQINCNSLEIFYQSALGSQ